MANLDILVRHHSKFGEETSPLRRWLAFNFVGGLGILIQLSTLAALTVGMECTIW